VTSLPVPADGPLFDVERARELMAADGLDAIVGHSLPHLYYLSGYLPLTYRTEPEAVAFAVVPANPAADAQLTVTADGCYSFEDFPTWIAEKVVFGSFYVRGGPVVRSTAVDSVDALAQALRAAGVERGRVGFELGHLPVDVQRRVLDAVPNIVMVDCTGLLHTLRIRKTPQEIERVRAATEAIEAAIDEAFANVEVGTSERELDLWIRECLLARGVEPATMSVGVGGGGALVWSYATHRRVAAGDVVRADITASYGSYHGDLARNCVVGESTPEQEKLHRVSYEALEAAIEAVRPGGTTGAVFSAAMDVFRAAGFDEFQRHNFGHGLGLHVHEQPLITPHETELPPGAVLAVETPHYVYGLGGFSSEDVVVVHEDRVERLTQAPAGLRVAG
jgi:Xaa-Pro aminopeptidase